MPTTGPTTGLGSEASRERQWFIVGRWHSYEGEGRANLLRIVAIASFYLIELLNYYGLNLGAWQYEPVVDRPFHLKVTALAVAWSMVALGTLLCLRARVFPAALKYVTTACDLLILTLILIVGDGPRSPLVVGYFLIIALATLRFDVRLIQCGTIGSIASYLVLLGYAKWYTDRDLAVPRHHQLIFLLALALAGIMLGQVIRRIRSMADAYAERVQAASR